MAAHNRTYRTFSIYQLSNYPSHISLHYPFFYSYFTSIGETGVQWRRHNKQHFSSAHLHWEHQAQRNHPTQSISLPNLSISRSHIYNRLLGDGIPCCIDYAPVGFVQRLLAMFWKREKPLRAGGQPLDTIVGNEICQFLGIGPTPTSKCSRRG